MPTPTLMSEADRLGTFYEVWDLVNDNYLYDDFHGMDWYEVQDQYEPKVIAASTAQEFYDTIGEMVGRLHDDHSRYLSPWAARAEDDFVNGRVNYAGIGITSVVEDNSLIILYVYPNSPAEQAGLKRRDHITSIDGRSVLAAGQQGVAISGPIMTTVRLTVRSPGQAPRDVVIQRQLVRGKVTASSRWLEADPTIGYLVVPSLSVGDMDKQVAVELIRLRQKALLHDQPLRGLVIDLRGNGGGLYRILKSVLGNFMTGEGGTLRTDNSDVQARLDKEKLSDFKITRSSLYDDFRSLPLVVLVDKRTVSAAELLAGILQATGRARVAGARSMGNTENVFSYNLEDGSRLWLAEAEFYLPDGATLEGKGVIPDATVDVDWSNYTEANDPQILKAVEMIHQGGGR